MQVEIIREREEKGYILYRRTKTRFKNCVPMLKYFIKDEVKYFKEFRTRKEADREFNKLTNNQ